MSATNWGTCPQCLVRAKPALEEIKKLYGTIPDSAYEVLIKDANAKALNDNLREDYEAYITDEACFVIYYGARCDVCGFEHSFNHKQQLDVGGYDA